MINHISIKDFAIIKNTEIDFEDGLNIITGETGSGKSIVVEAVSLALGSRADSSYVRTGADKAVIQLAGQLDEEEVIISREISQSGKNLCRLNGNLVTLGQLNEVSRKLADIHGQYDNQSLLNPENHISLLDSYSHRQIQPLKEEVALKYRQYARVRTALAELISMEKENRRKVDFYRFEVDEIEKAALKPGEDKEWEEQISVLQNSEKIFENTERAYALLNGASPSAMDSLRGALRSIEEISSFSQELSSISQEFNDLYYRLEDLCRLLRDSREKLTFDPSRLDHAISRLDQIENLKKKYGTTIEEILQYHDTISSQLTAIESYGEKRSLLEKELKSRYADLTAACAQLTKARKTAASQLEKEIEQELTDLNFSDPNIQIQINPLDRPSEHGADKVEIYIRTNRGESLKPLSRIISGGEMSRMMLAFKKIVSAYDEIPTLIFDEIDTGISGVTASIVGKKLKEIAKDHQILCITHLPQIAACGDQNYRIYKESDKDNTFTHVEALNEEEKVKEIARLLGGTTVTETTLQSARELIKCQKRQSQNSTENL